MEAKVFFAKCKVKGCKTGRPFRSRSTVSYGRDVPITSKGNRYSYIDLSEKGEWYWADAVAAGWVCDEHGTMEVSPVRGRWNPDKVCDGRCTKAKRPQCDCSCSGANHGSESANF